MCIVVSDILEESSYDLTYASTDGHLVTEMFSFKDADQLIQRMSCVKSVMSVRVNVIVDEDGCFLCVLPCWCRRNELCSYDIFPGSNYTSLLDRRIHDAATVYAFPHVSSTKPRSICFYWFTHMHTYPIDTYNLENQKT
jgi:hypothetical protein